MKHKHTAAQCDKACVNWAKVFWSWKKKMKWSYKKQRIKCMNNNNKKYNTKNKEQVKLKLTIKWRVLKLRNIEKYAFKLRIIYNKYINKIYTKKY